MMKPMKRTAHFMTEQQVKNLAAESKRTGLNVSEIIRRAVDQYLQQQPKT